MNMKMVLASNNPGKIQELQSLLSHLKVTLIPQIQLGIEEIAETGITFVENALLKARHATKATGLPAIADDSGLVVPALSGAPGIYSARYAGDKATAQDNIAKLLANMTTIPDNKRQASFYCVLVFLNHAHDPMPLICTGEWSGILLSAPRGQQGFGYDPIFYVPTEHQTAAELNLSRKNIISHRGQALQLLLQQLPTKLSQA